MKEKIKDTKKPLSQDNEVSDDSRARTEQAGEKETTSDGMGENQASVDEQTLAEPAEPEKDPLEEAREQIASLKDKLLCTVAEFENYKKRTIKEKMELIQNGGAKTVSALLPVLDDFERAVADKSEDPKAIKKGTQMILNKFVKTLESIGVKQIDAVGEDFNTDFHEAVAMVPGAEDDKKGKVIDCVQTGYTMNDKVIRHAKVAVGQ
ncbi:molecular chaperone GrpE [Prevotella sp. S7-1-8]|uniref:nucleotide exchange factor GrpE n=1 Tax=Prevotella sp. S7-1-8 TaxID=1284775 RepID=UPI0005104E7F|nr:nucleotide exchange factor GrpE [Prevotella sp. S7-1-8]KGF16874.1 molecular chaperone GrpE [Prevotella sp. S7-1-8]